MISLHEARVSGVKRYFTGKPCSKGHIFERRVSDRSCIQCHNNKINARYQAEGEHRRQRRIERYAANIELSRKQGREQQARRRAADPEGVRQKDRDRYANSLARALQVKLAAALRKKRLKAAQIDVTDPVTASGIEAQLVIQNGMCYYCPVEIINNYTLDHYIPLSRGGMHSMSNIKLSCGPCNDSKCDRLHIIEWQGRRI